MKTNLIKARGTHTPTHCLGVELALKGVIFTRLGSKRVFETRVSPIHSPDGLVMLMSLNKGDTAVHSCHFPGDMAVRRREVLARQAVGWCMCASCFKFVLPFFMTYAIHMKGCFLVLFCGVPGYCPESGLF